MGHLPLQICIESHSNIMHCYVMYLKAYIWHTEPFKKKLEGPWVFSLFLGYKGQHLTVCAKMISSWVRKVLSISRTQRSMGTFLGVLACVALATGIYLVSILQVGDWARVPTLAKQYFQHISLPQSSTIIHFCMPSLATD